MSTKIEARTTCRVCGSSNLTKLFSLGSQYVSTFTDHNRFLNSDIPYCPIELEMCQNCTLIQQKYTAPSEFMYTRHYWYRSGVTKTMRNELGNIVESAMEKVGLRVGDIVLDIGANDGTLLSYYPNEGLVRVAVEPASNMLVDCTLNCDVFINDFWNEESYNNCMNGQKAKIITAIGMFYDLDDPNAFIADVAKILHPEGIFVCQLMCAKQMYEQKDVGNLAHEHLEFYTLASLCHLFSKNGLDIIDIEENKVNGGSYRIYVKHQCVHTPEYIPGTKRVSIAIDNEKHLYESNVWIKWFNDNLERLDKLRQWIRSNVLATDNLMYVYGASTKGNVLLQWWDLQNGIHVHGAADKSVEKHGKYTVGTGIRICSEDEMRKINPKYLLVLPYAFINEFIERERVWMDRGGIFVVPLPTLRTYQLVDGQVKETIL